MAASAHALRRDHAGAAAEEGIENDVAPSGAIQNGVGDQPHRLDRGMQGQQIPLIAGRARAWIVPNVRAIATVFAEEYVVAVRGAAVLEDEDQLVPAAVERPHAGVVFHPDADIFKLGIDALPSRK
jgi:hypothetical protein